MKKLLVCVLAGAALAGAAVTDFEVTSVQGEHVS